MKVTVIGSHLCPDTLYALNQMCIRDRDWTASGGPEMSSSPGGRIRASAWWPGGETAC